MKTYVVLEPETKSDEELLASLQQSVAGSASGDAEKRSHTLVWHDQADAGEAQLRIPGLRNRGGHLQRFVRLVQQRKDPNQELIHKTSMQCVTAARMATKAGCLVLSALLLSQMQQASFKSLRRARSKFAPGQPPCQKAASPKDLPRSVDSRPSTISDHQERTAAQSAPKAALQWHEPRKFPGSIHGILMAAGQ